ncbi:MAG: hypothetical protein J1E29_01005 [Duncaniella sp.]|nr:hypothetical protein [Duncaniella sp.]
MSTPLARITAALATPAAMPDPADVADVVAAYPFFTLPAVVALRRGGSELSEELRRRLMNLIALNSPDARSLFMLSSPSTEQLLRFYPAEDCRVTTADAITKFLDTYGNSDPAEEALLERLIFNPVPPDYMALLEQEEKQLPEPAAEQVPPVEPLEKVEPVVPLREPEPIIPATPRTTPHEDSSLSESLAKIYIRQHRYDKAFEIISSLSLNNPKKSAYFADQLRFLAKLKLIEERKNNK